ncbi:semaphorin-7A isoform X2 [Protopterus annectens]|uniref:semaphorin-7A isoform X2 n=1 Tax=Protopterus annectens TaxID=7888 RepID=UPI001CFA1BC1|nr:semaphorin-7A isoform X2 [Protopterus annectens]
MKAMTALSGIIFITGPFFLCVDCYPFLSGSRIISKNDLDFKRFRFTTRENNAVFLFNNDTDSIYVGTVNKLHVFNFEEPDKNYTVTFPPTSQSACSGSGKLPSLCENFITVLHKYEGKNFICGTNAYSPKCWYWTNESKKEVLHNNEKVGYGLSPFYPTKNLLSTVIDGDIYSTASTFFKNGFERFRRAFGKREQLYTNSDEKWMAKPTYIAASLIKQESQNNVDNDKIYIFFRENKKLESHDSDCEISRVAQVCKNDQGSNSENKQWTTFLKAKLACSDESRHLYFSRLQDVFILHDPKNWRMSKVYGIFSSPYNVTAVCVYFLKDIDQVFIKSTFKDYNGDIPNPRPGTCLDDSKKVATITINLLTSNPEMNDTVHPIGQKPLFISHHRYHKIAVDIVTPTDHNAHTVLVLATEKGTIHKIIETKTSVSNILEINALHLQAPVHYMKLDSDKRKLYLGTSSEIIQIPLDTCDIYGGTCGNCILARDPYCLWTENKCVSSTRSGLQDVESGNASKLCEEIVKLQARSSEELESKKTKYEGTVLQLHTKQAYFSCPTSSLTAVYWWQHEHLGNFSCVPSNNKCLHLIESMTENRYGTYKCMSTERGYTQTLAVYHVVQSKGNGLLVSGQTGTIFSVLLSVAAFLLVLTNHPIGEDPSRNQTLNSIAICILFAQQGTFWNTNT